jgi:hypothetical protein
VGEIVALWSLVPNAYTRLIINEHDFFPPCNQICFYGAGASTVKWTALDPCSSLSESDPKLYTNFEYYEIKIHLENIWIYKANQFMFTKKQFQTLYMYVRDVASGEQVGDIEKIIVKNLFKI